MKNFTDIIKIFLEKHFIPTVIAIVGAILINAFTTTDFILLARLGNFWYGILSFCACFLIVQLIILLASQVKQLKRNVQRDRDKQDEIERENYKACEMLWSRVDGMSQNDFEYLMQFIKTNNSPISDSSNYFGDCLFNSDLVNATIIKEESKEYFTFPKPDDVKGAWMPIPQEIYTPPTKQYKLKDDFFNLLKYSYDKYGRISHFKKEETK